VTIQVGQGGNNLACSYWEQLYCEKESRKCVNFYDSGSRLVPRCLLVDLEPGVLNSIRGSLLGPCFGPESYLSLQSGAGNNWAAAHYNLSSQIMPDLLDAVRKQAEQCEGLEAFQVWHSLGGGTGAGLGSLIAAKLKEEYSDRLLQTVSVFPSEKVSHNIV
jgi:tubulin beta